MTNEITVNTLGDAVRDRVKKAIFDSIPDTAIESLIASELKKMTEKTEYVSGTSQRMSPLEVTISREIQKQLNERAQKAVAEYIDLNYQNKSKEMIDAAIKELAPVFMAGMVENFASQAVNGLRSQLNNKGIYL